MPGGSLRSGAEAGRFVAAISLVGRMRQLSGGDGSQEHVTSGPWLPLKHRGLRDANAVWALASA